MGVWISIYAEMLFKKSSALPHSVAGCVDFCLCKKYFPESHTSSHTPVWQGGWIFPGYTRCVTLWVRGCMTNSHTHVKFCLRKWEFIQLSHFAPFHSHTLLIQESLPSLQKPIVHHYLRWEAFLSICTWAFSFFLKVSSLLQGNLCSILEERLREEEGESPWLWRWFQEEIQPHHLEKGDHSY